VTVPATGPAADARQPIRRALISVYDKAGLSDLARGLHAAGVVIISTGSTAQAIAAAGVPVTPVEAVTQSPEMLDGRVKTLHPNIHAGLLADLRKAEHRTQLADRGIEPIGLLVSNLYPFRETAASGVDDDDVVEQIDIGGPAMVRAAAKNHPSVAVVVDPVGYDDLLAVVRAGGFDLAARRTLAARAFAYTAAYDVAVASWFAQPDHFPPFVGIAAERAETLRYGENPHQQAALYVDHDAPPGLAQAAQLHGREMSYNNYVDTDAARRSVLDFAPPCVAIIKHANPCGIAVGADIAEAHRKAHACDPQSAYGGVIATNRAVSLEMAEQVSGILTDVIIAPSYDDGALDVLRRRKNIRILRCEPPAERSPVELHQITGGLLVQTVDRVDAAGDEPAGWTLATGEPVGSETLADLAFAWRAVRSVKSNAIALAHDRATVGIGMGQVSRVDAARLAVARAGVRTAGSVAASDAFFPFPDGLQVLIDAGVRIVVQPGGSIRDREVIEAAQAARITMYLTDVRHFYH